MFNFNRRLVGLFFASFVFVVATSFNIAVQAEDISMPIPDTKPAYQAQEDDAEEDVVEEVINEAPMPAAKPDIVFQPIVIEEDHVEQTDVAETSETEQTIQPDQRIFSDKQARLTKEIFVLQEQGKIEEADKIIANLSNDLLLGHILAERYLHPHYVSSVDELKSWLSKYGDHPQASTIYKLAAFKNRGDDALLPKPQFAKKISGNLNAKTWSSKIYVSSKKRDADQQDRVQKLKKEIYQAVKTQQPSLALNILSNDYAVQFIDDVEYDRLRAKIAAGYFYAGKFDDALRLANSSLSRSDLEVPFAAWIAGLVHWQNKDYKKAAKSFEKAAVSEYSSGWMVSAAAYWASRSAMRSGNPAQVSEWLRKSAQYPRTFYGLIATKALGHNSIFNWSIPSLKRSHIKIIEGDVRGKRALALIDIGKKALAEEELKYFELNKSSKRQQAILAFATHHNLSSLLMRLGNAFPDNKGHLYDAALYPLIEDNPQSGYQLERALVHAVVRQESRFNQLVSNPSGATGLMQLMPATASHVSGRAIYKEPIGQYQLRDSHVNLDLGQRYIQELLNHPAVDNDLMLMAIAYNAGPGNLSKWKKERTHIDDPLLFIESIPYYETRAFVERVISNYWIYQIRLDQATPTLDAVASGRWAKYNEQKIAAR